MIFHTPICVADATNCNYRRAESDIQLAIPSTRCVCGMEVIMKISTKGRYALRLMLELASDNSGKPVSIKDISKKQGISEKYLEQIISLLNKAGMVKSIRGAQGGYILTKNPDEYTVGMIFRVTEGDLAPVKCVSDGENCDRKETCIPAILYEKINDAVNEVVDTTTLEDLINWKMEKKRG